MRIIRYIVRWKYILWKNWRGSFSTRAILYIRDIFITVFVLVFVPFEYPFGEGTDRRNRLIKRITPSFERDVASSKILLTHCVFSRDEGRDAFSSTRWTRHNTGCLLPTRTKRVERANRTKILFRFSVSTRSAAFRPLRCSLVSASSSLNGKRMPFYGRPCLFLSFLLPFFLSFYHFTVSERWMIFRS